MTLLENKLNGLVPTADCNTFVTAHISGAVSVSRYRLFRERGGAGGLRLFS